MGEKGWMKIPGLRPEGDRTIEEQMLGLDRGLAEAKGKTVLDLGCAEGAIGLAFAKAGAVRVVGIELLEGHLAIARKLCAGYPQMEFHKAHLNDWLLEHEPPEQFDIVLALGIVHKLDDPCVGLAWACRSTKDLLCFRGPGRDALRSWDGVIRSKHTRVACDVPKTMKKHGFALEATISGARNEGVHYYRRKR